MHEPSYWIKPYQVTMHQESLHTHKKSKTTKALEKEFLDNNNILSNFPIDALMKLITKQTIVLGEIQVQFQALQVWPPGGASL